jgi:serine/threonine protein phosphatase PrpC
MVAGERKDSDFMNACFQTAAGNPENQDRGLILNDGPRIILCVADGAGGRSGGAEAATLAVKLIRQDAHLLVDADACVEALRKMDGVTSKDPVAGETTCVLAIVTPEEIFGASVGDSGAWWISESVNHLNLTEAQQRKPFIGSGSAWPVPFRHKNQPGNLLLATDGLLKYTSAERIIGTCREQPTEIAARQLIELVRYPSGGLPDDVTLIITKL